MPQRMVRKHSCKGHRVNNGAKQQESLVQGVQRPGKWCQAGPQRHMQKEFRFSPESYTLWLGTHANRNVLQTTWRIILSKELEVHKSEWYFISQLRKKRPRGWSQGLHI